MSLDNQIDDENYDEFYESIDNKKRNKDIELLISLNLETISREEYKENKNITIKPNLKMTDDYLNMLLAYKYQEANGKTSEFVKSYVNPYEKQKIIEWLHNTYRWDTYSFLIGAISRVNLLNDDNLYERMNEIIQSWLNISNIELAKFIKVDENYKPIPIEEFDQLVYQFLLYINAPYNWALKYNEIRMNNYLKFNKDKESECYRDTDGNTKINIKGEITLRSFSAFIHEFIHYIIMTKENHTPNMLLDEFPSLFFENISLRFLKEKGYPEYTLAQIMKERKKFNYGLSVHMASIYNDIAVYKKNGKITKKDKKSYYENEILRIKRKKKESYAYFKANNIPFNPSDFKDPVIDDSDNKIDEDCDTMIRDCIINGYQQVGDYRYLFGSHYADRLFIESENNPSVIGNMIYVIYNIENMSAQDILKTFNLDKEQSRKLDK